MNPSSEVACELTVQELLDLPPADTSVEIEDISSIDTALLACADKEATIEPAPADAVELELGGAEINALLESTAR